MLVEDRPTVADHDVALVSATLVEERERDRLTQRAGRTGVAAFVAAVPAVFRRAGTAEAAEAGLRYQPIAWTLIAVTAVAFWFPGRDDGAARLTPIAAAPTTVVPSLPVPTSVVGAPTTTAAPVPAPAPSFTPRPIIPAPVVQSPPPTFASPAPTAPPTTRPAAPQPLRIRGHGWAGSTGSTGIGITPVPDGTLPVAKRLGSVDKVSFVRLSGTATTLTLAENTSGAAESFGDGSVKLCVITDAGWQETPGQPMADAPAWSDTCAAGVENSDTWTFDLSGLGDPGAQTGFALVPGDSAPAEFQLTFNP